jgi:hypothetical protein
MEGFASLTLRVSIFLLDVSHIAKLYHDHVPFFIEEQILFR